MGFEGPKSVAALTSWSFALGFASGLFASVPVSGAPVSGSTVLSAPLSPFGVTGELSSSPHATRNIPQAAPISVNDASP